MDPHIQKQTSQSWLLCLSPSASNTCPCSFRIGFVSGVLVYARVASLMKEAAILNLQRTTPANLASKKQGQIYHQLFGGLAFASITLGSIAMIVNKALHGWGHFTSWHARLGLLTYILLVSNCYPDTTDLLRELMVSFAGNSSSCWGRKPLVRWSGLWRRREG